MLVRGAFRPPFVAAESILAPMVVRLGGRVALMVVGERAEGWGCCYAAWGWGLQDIGRVGNRDVSSVTVAVLAPIDTDSSVVASSGDNDALFRRAARDRHDVNTVTWPRSYPFAGKE